MVKNSSRKRILVLHGPNLNLLGKREPDIYGHENLAEIDARLKEKGDKLGIDVETFQSNHEGALVDKIQQAAGTVQGVVINPAAYTHTSVAIRDALLVLGIPIIEIHLSNINKREPFRHTSMIADIVAARIAGFGSYGYLLALEGLIEMLKRG
jgi:3-dehydroquinate dehydratase-2